MSAAAGEVDVWATVVGQGAAVATLRAGALNPVHAYLFVGPPGSGVRPAARAFAGEILAAGAEPHDADRHRRLALAEHHPDMAVTERVGAAISAEAAAEIVRSASLSPAEGSRKVMVLVDFHLLKPAAAARLLKTIEEPPPNTFFVVLAEEVTPELVTIASRCARVDFPALSTDAVVAELIATGIADGRAREVAEVAHGDLDRARLLVTDERLALRLQLWREVPRRVDRSGHVAAGLVDEVRANIDDAAGPLKTAQGNEVAQLSERIERYGQRGSGAKELAERHKRELRRLRTDELRMGLAELARTYRDQLATSAEPAAVMAAIDAVGVTSHALERNPSEELALQVLFVCLPRIS